MQLPKELITVTPLSKIVALILFLLVPILGFLFGMKYQKAITITNVAPIISPSLTLIPANQDETTGWKIYTSSMDFTFLYPTTWFISETGSSQFPDLRIQNYNPKTAPGRGYDPVQDKGKYLISVNRFPAGNEGIYTLDQLITKLPKEGDQAYYIGVPAGQIQILKSEKGELNGFPKLFRTISYSKLSEVREDEIYLLNKKGEILSIEYGLDVVGGKKILDKILSTFRFL